MLTGGLVVWRSGTAAVVYRGKDYIPPSVQRKTEKEETKRLDLQEGDESENRIDKDKVDCNADDLAEHSAVEVPGEPRHFTSTSQVLFNVHCLFNLTMRHLILI